jgi:hypothetical protein
MNEQEWLACTDPKTILGQYPGTLSDRKLRLAALAAFRPWSISPLTNTLIVTRNWWVLSDELLERAEALAEGRVSYEQVVRYLPLVFSASCGEDSAFMLPRVQAKSDDTV